MKNTHAFGHQRNVAHPSNMSQPRLRAVKGKPLIQQADAFAPAFEVFAAF
jgi:hypothetical protein